MFLLFFEGQDVKKKIMGGQLELFGEEVKRVVRRERKGGSHNPIVFRDYESFLAKFTENPKTTDECWTPPDVYEAVVRYVGEIYDLSGKELLRPFYPGGDYENAVYPENGVVVDNPPFSIFAKICKFYSEAKIPFFLFGPGMTIMVCCRWCTAVVVADQLVFTNGAKVRVNFATNLLGDMMATTSVRLSELLRRCPSQNVTVDLPKYGYPGELLSVSDLQTLANGDVDFGVSRREAVPVKDLDLHPKRNGLFGNHLLISEAKAEAVRTIPVLLSARERRIVDGLG